MVLVTVRRTIAGFGIGYRSGYFRQPGLRLRLRRDRAQSVSARVGDAAGSPASRSRIAVSIPIEFPATKTI